MKISEEQPTPVEWKDWVIWCMKSINTKLYNAGFKLDNTKYVFIEEEIRKHMPQQLKPLDIEKIEKEVGQEVIRRHRTEWIPIPEEAYINKYEILLSILSQYWQAPTSTEGEKIDRLYNVKEIMENWGIMSSDSIDWVNPIISVDKWVPWWDMTCRTVSVKDKNWKIFMIDSFTYPTPQPQESQKVEYKMWTLECYLQWLWYEEWDIKEIMQFANIFISKKVEPQSQSVNVDELVRDFMLDIWDVYQEVDGPSCITCSGEYNYKYYTVVIRDKLKQLLSHIVPQKQQYPRTKVSEWLLKSWWVSHNEEENECLQVLRDFLKDNWLLRE